ncbi:MAG: hypothetical protein WCE80_01515 [Acidimicrobiia bacterium]
MTCAFYTDMIPSEVRRVEKVEGATLLQHDTQRSEPEGISVLSEIMYLVDVRGGASSDGWHGESARLFAIDGAILVVRRHSDQLPEVDRQALMAKLQEARRLAVAKRDSELGFLQVALESHLALAEPGWARQLWLISIDALIPSPFRAALAVARSALFSEADASPDLARVLRDRLLARLDEGSLLTEPSSTLFLIA